MHLHWLTPMQHRVVQALLSPTPGSHCLGLQRWMRVPRRARENTHFASHGFSLILLSPPLSAYIRNPVMGSWLRSTFSVFSAKPIITLSITPEFFPEALMHCALALVIGNPERLIQYSGIKGLRKKLN